MGGNAFDAAVAAQFAAFVSEPLLTGVAGAGIATFRKSNGDVFQLDFFSTMPGLTHTNPSPRLREMSKVEINLDQQLSNLTLVLVLLPRQQ